MKTALVIDDNRITADSLCQMLDLLDVYTKAAYSPRGAILMLAEFSPNIVFVDINMPGVTGFEILSYCKRDPKLENIPVVFVTSDDQDETRKRAKEGGAFGLIVKPASFDTLEKVLKDAKII
jgi:CheY-like chemotaxis protein